MVTYKDISEKMRMMADGFIEAARERLKANDYNLACFMAGQAVQLYLKSTILKLSGEVPRTRSIRQLITILSSLLDRSFDFDRRLMIFLEATLVSALYFGLDYGREDAEDAIKIAEEVISTVSRYLEEESRNF